MTRARAARLKPRRPPVRWIRSWSMGIFGMLIGAIFGFLTYWFGAAIVAGAALIATEPGTLPSEMMRPFQGVTAWEIVLVVIGAIIGGSVARSRWHSAGLLSYLALLSMIAGYVAYSLTVSIPDVPSSQRWVSYCLLVAETGGLGLVVVFSFYSLDAATRRRWTRLARENPWDPLLQPHVAIMVPVYNEPFELVQQTIVRAMNQDYPRDRLTVMVLDDSSDPKVRWRLSTLCAQVGAQYVHRETRRGYKAGALNHGIALLPPEVESIAIVDADYWLEPHYVKSVVGYFVNPRISFVQAPQDYRNTEESFLTRQYKRAEAYFYHAIMPSRNEQSAIIFCGTMGMLRRKALAQVGGFAEDQICEDAEVSVRLAAHGWDSLYVEESLGKGLMPATFDAYKKQFHRWAFGNVRILFTRTWMIMRSKQMTGRQKFDFLVSNLHWFDGFFVTAIALILLYLGLGPVFGYDAVTHHQRELALIALVPLVLLVDGVSRLHLVLRQTYKARVWDVFLVQGMWFSIKFTNITAVLKCMLGFKTAFVRTPKLTGGKKSRTGAFFRALRLTKIESLLGIGLLTVAILNARLIQWDDVAPTAVLLPIWTSMYALFFLCSPLYAYFSYRTLKPMRYDTVATTPAPRSATPEALMAFTLAPKSYEANFVTSAAPKKTGALVSVSVVLAFALLLGAGTVLALSNDGRSASEPLDDVDQDERDDRNGGETDPVAEPDEIEFDDDDDDDKRDRGKNRKGGG